MIPVAWMWSSISHWLYCRQGYAEQEAEGRDVAEVCPRDKMDREALKKKILTVPDTLPARARIFKSVTCEQCGETCSERNVRLHEGKQLCIDCAPDYSRGW